MVFGKGYHIARCVATRDVGGCLVACPHPLEHVFAAKNQSLGIKKLFASTMLRKVIEKNSIILKKVFPSEKGT